MNYCKPFIKILLALFCVTGVIFIDYDSKNILRNMIEEGHVIYINKFLNLRVVLNHGIALGFLNEYANYLTIMILVSFTIVVLIFFIINNYHNEFNFWFLILLLGGALANLLDRILFDVVYDFIELHIKGWSWPVFNLADFFIFISVIFLLIYNLFLNKDHTCLKK